MPLCVCFTLCKQIGLRKLNFDAPHQMIWIGCCRCAGSAQHCPCLSRSGVPVPPCPSYFKQTALQRCCAKTCGICGDRIPTQIPTFHPTQIPASPTSAPTITPTTLPSTFDPTQTPTVAPTAAQSPAPSTEPTQASPICADNNECLQSKSGWNAFDT